MNKLPKLICKNVWKLYGDKPKEFLHQHNNNPDQETIKKAGYIQAIRDASLEVYENEILVVMGLSGSGKSTLVRCMSRLVDPTIGEIFFENIDKMEKEGKIVQWPRVAVPQYSKIANIIGNELFDGIFISHDVKESLNKAQIQAEKLFDLNSN
jgi:ABC-type oligopeptide transport system ATPase subunit